MNLDPSVSKSRLLIELGAKLGEDVPAILWESGSGTPKSGNFTINSLLESTAKTPYLNATTYLSDVVDQFNENQSNSIKSNNISGLTSLADA